MTANQPVRTVVGPYRPAWGTPQHCRICMSKAVEVAACSKCQFWTCHDVYGEAHLHVECTQCGGLSLYTTRQSAQKAEQDKKARKARLVGLATVVALGVTVVWAVIATVGWVSP